MIKQNGLEVNLRPYYQTISGCSTLVSPVGLGTVKFGRNQKVKYKESTFELPSDQIIEELLTIAWNAGVNLVDTAPAYGSAEERLGRHLKAQKKQGRNWVISTKVGEEFVNGESVYDFSQKHLIESVERSLKRLDRETLDLVFLHCPKDDFSIVDQPEVAATLNEMKRQGLLRAWGSSTTSLRGGMKALEIADAVMVAFNKDYLAELPVIEQALKLKKTVFIKKGLLSGHLDQASLPKSFEAIFNIQPRITSLIFGTTNPENLKANLRAAQQSLVS